MYSGLYKMLEPSSYKTNEPMKNHTTFKIGGPVDVLVLPRTVYEIKTVISYCHEFDIPLLVLGLGSNLLVRDKGIRGIAIKVGNNLQEIQAAGDQIYAQTGISMANLAKQAATNSLSGLEFAEGIPGSLGGAVVMNAGAFDGEMQNVVIEVEALSPSGESIKINCDDIGFQYRKSIFQQNKYILTAVRLQLRTGIKEDIQNKMAGFAQSRRDKQPLEYPSAGSVFKRPPGYYVGPMIEELGLKGYRIGGAEISVKHAGFIVNRGNATASDVLSLINYIINAVKEKYGVDLKPEIQVVGEE